MYFDNGNGRNRKVFQLSQVVLDDEYLKSLIGFHALTGNDYVSSFFRKGKKMCGNKLKDSAIQMTAVTQLGDNLEVSPQQYDAIEKYLCRLYNSRKSKVNDARFEMFTKKYVNGK